MTKPRKNLPIAGEAAPFKSGYFAAASLSVPPSCMADGSLDFQQVDPHKSLLVIEGKDGAKAELCFVDDPDTGGLLAVVPTKTTGFVKVLLPLGQPAGDYTYQGTFYRSGTDEVNWQPSGGFTVEAEQVDCGCRTLGWVIRTRARTADDRFAVCAGCPFNEGGVCMECGCQVSHKVTNPAESCPVGKWGVESIG